MSVGIDTSRENRPVDSKDCPPGRYLLREDDFWGKPFEADILEWSVGGRVKLRHLNGNTQWRERGINDRLPLLLEPLPAIAMETRRAETLGSVGEADDSAAIAQPL